MKRFFCFTLFLLTRFAHARAPADEQVLSGSCTSQSFWAQARIDEDVTTAKQPFPCEQVRIIFSGPQHNRVRFSFAAPDGTPRICCLAFTGTRSLKNSTGLTFDVSELEFNGSPALHVTDGWCKVFFDGPHVKSVFCGTKYTGGMQYYASVVFEATPGQSFGDGDGRP